MAIRNANSTVNGLPRQPNGFLEMTKMEDLSKILTAPVVKHSVTIAGHATSVSVEKPFWDAFQTLADAQGKSTNQLVKEIDAARPKTILKCNLSSAIRLYVLDSLK